jgi:hypothetical protein
MNNSLFAGSPTPFKAFKQIDMNIIDSGNSAIINKSYRIRKIPWNKIKK